MFKTTSHVVPIVSNIYRDSTVHMPTLPEGEEDNGLDGDELEHRVVLGEQFPRGRVKEDQTIQGNGDRDVVG